MSVGEIVGLVATALLFGLLAGYGTARFIHRRYLQRHRRRDLLNAYARWLAARKTQSRASASLVAAYRFLAAEPQGTGNYALRQLEAQRTREFWCEAVGELDRAEAALFVRGCNINKEPMIADFARTEAGALHAAIKGTGEDVERLLRTLQRADECAQDAVSAAIQHVDRGNPSPLRQSWRGLLGWIRKIFDGWEQV